MTKKTDLIWTDPNILFDPVHMVGAKPIRGGAGKRKNVYVDDGRQETFTVAQIASLWQLSTDTIQRWFEDEPGVLTSGNNNPRGRRKRVTLRIPRAVMERVKRRRMNK